MHGAGVVQGPCKPGKERAAAVGTVASSLCPPCLHPWPTGPHPARLYWCTGGGGQDSAAEAAFLGDRSPSLSRGQSRSGGWGGRARVVPLPQFPQPLSTRVDAVPAVSGGSPGCVVVGTSVEDTRWQQWAACAERSRTAAHGRVSPWPGPRGRLDHGHGSRLDHGHTSIPWPHPHWDLGHPPWSQRGPSWRGGMGAAGKWVPHPCALEVMGAGGEQFPRGSSVGSSSRLGWGDAGREGQEMLGGPCPPPASGTWAGRSLGWGGETPSRHTRAPGI